MADLLARLDNAMRELAELRRELVEQLPDYQKSNDRQDDYAPDDLLDTHAASARFGYPPDTIRKWARTEALGVRRAGRWWISTRLLRRRLNGGSA